MEIWVPIKGYDGIYEISNIGNVKSLPKKWVSGHSTVRSHTGKIIKPTNNQHGYLYVSLSNGEFKKTFKIHRLVAMAFIPQIENKNIVNHKNGIKTDNSVDNLEWVNSSENMIHAVKTGLTNPRKGVKSNLSKLNDEIVKQIREIYFGKKITQKEIAVMYGINQSNVSHIIKGITWK